MKKLLLILCVILPNVMRAQTEVANATSSIIKLNGNNIPARLKKLVNVPVKNNIASFEVEYFEGLNKRGPIKMYRRLDKQGSIIIRDFNPETDLAVEFNEVGDAGVSNTSSEVSVPRSIVGNTDGWWSNVTVTPENQTDDYSIFVPSEPFMGLALEPGQKSSRSVTLKTGKIMFPVLLGSDDDKSQSGMSFTWALVNKILTEGQEVLEIKAKDIMFANKGETIRKTVLSKLPFDFMISEGASQGTVIPANYPQKLELFLGWNIV